MMLSSAEIEINLNQLDQFYKNSTSGDPKETYFYSKLAILELGGWLEMMIDDMIISACNNMTHDPEVLTKVTKFVNGIYGFEYGRHFCEMLIYLVGYVKFKEIESKIDETKLDSMLGYLGGLKNHRNHCAHTYANGVLNTINAPSVTLTFLKPLIEGFKEFENELAKI